MHPHLCRAGNPTHGIAVLSIAFDHRPAASGVPAFGDSLQARPVPNGDPLAAALDHSGVISAISWRLSGSRLPVRFDPDQGSGASPRATNYRFDMERIMKTITTHGRLSISGLGWSFSATLVVLFVLCMLAALFVPLRLAHGWISLWSDAPIDHHACGSTGWSGVSRSDG